MSAYLLVPLISCVICAMLATAILSRQTVERVKRPAARLVGAASLWAFCELLWNVQNDPSDALMLVRASAIGWAWLGPLALHLFVELSGERLPRVRRLLPGCYAVSAAFVLLTWFTPWMHASVLRTGWGWAYEFGPAYPYFYAFMVACIGLALGIGWRGIGRAPSAGERNQQRWVTFGVVLPLVVASLTDGILPLLGIQVPRLGTASFAALGAVILWTFQRYGYSLLAPDTFAAEILETLPDGVAMLRLDGRVRSANHQLALMLGERRVDLPGMRLTDRLSEPVHPTEDVMERRCELVTATGERMPVAISSALLHDRQGAEIGLVLVVRNLDEVVALRDRLLLSGRLAAVGELAAGMAHEINNPLAFVRANLGLMRQHWSSLGGELEKAGAATDKSALLSEGEELLDESLEGVDRATAIVRDVRGLAHASGGERRAADLKELLEGVLRIAAPQLRAKAEVEKCFGEVPPVWGAPQELQQVFLNLVLNAGQAIEGRGTIRVSTECRERFAVVCVEDDGCGIEPENRDRIFDPFFTTKKVGEGTGLGLGIAHGIVRNHGGDITVDSAPGRGTTFGVHLPLAADTIESDDESA